MKKTQGMMCMAFGVGAALGAGSLVVTPLALGLGAGGAALLIQLPARWKISLAVGGFIFGLSTTCGEWAAVAAVAGAGGLLSAFRDWAGPLFDPFWVFALGLALGMGATKWVPAWGVAIGIGLTVLAYRGWRRRRMVQRVGRFEWIEYSSQSRVTPLSL